MFDKPATASSRTLPGSWPSTKEPVVKQQCEGTTRDGRRCRILLPGDTTYCRYHRAQDTNVAKMMASLSISTRSVCPGFIYVYTLSKGHGNAHIFNHIKNKFVPLQAHKSSTKSVRQLFHIKSKSAKQYNDSMLVKVGYTTKEPAKRLAEWRKKCQHPIELMAPPSDSNAAKTYDSSKQGWHSTQARQAEGAIHNELRAIFGHGHVECQGCSSSGRHVEWFLLDKSKLTMLFNVVEYWVDLYKSESEE